jgi:hypothetical protein
MLTDSLVNRYFPVATANSLVLKCRKESGVSWVKVGQELL